MISKELYNDRMRKAIMFTGHNLKKEAVDVIYDEVAKNYTNRDFENAITDIMELETYRLNGISLVKRLNWHRSNRMEQESRDRQEREREEVIKIWHEGSFAEVCQTHKCGSCDKVRCDEIARAAIAYMKDILAFEPDIRLTPEEQREQKILYRELKKEKLIRDFPGAGFERSYPKKEGIYLDELQGKKPSSITRQFSVVEKLKSRADIDNDFPEEREEA